jgi:hypothetical protein
MALAKAQVRGKGLTKLNLIVFEQNAGENRLYDRPGTGEISFSDLNSAKSLPDPADIVHNQPNSPDGQTLPLSVGLLMPCSRGRRS